MNHTVPVPHRSSLPTTQLGNRFEWHHPKPGYFDDLEQAMDLVHQEYEDYAGYPDVQQALLAEAVDDVTFSREVIEAAVRIKGVAVETPLWVHDGVIVKDETVQLTKAYKLRGACNFIFKHIDRAYEAGVITASAGNHGHAVALAAAKIGVSAIVVVPEGTPDTKKDGILSHGGQVIVYGSDYVAATAEALRMNANQRGLYVPAYNHRDIMAGQATMGLELSRQVPDMTDLVVPTGGGGALAGLAKLFRTVSPTVKLWGSGVTGSSAVASAFSSGNAAQTPTSHFADGIAVSKLGDVTWPEIQRSVRGALTVRELKLRLLVGQLSLAGRIVEGAGAVGLAAALENRTKLGSSPVTIATGGNIDFRALQSCQLLAMGRRP